MTVHRSAIIWLLVRPPLPSFLLILLVSPCCTSPKSPPSADRLEVAQTRTQAIQSRSSPLGEAVSPSSTPQTAPPLPTLLPTNAGCILSLTGDSFFVDCTFAKCPREALATLVVAEAMTLVSENGDWHLELHRNRPPLRPEVDLRLAKQTASIWRMEGSSLGNAAAECLLKGSLPPVGNDGHTPVAITGIAIRSQLGAPKQGAEL